MPEAEALATARAGATERKKENIPDDLSVAGAGSGSLGTTSIYEKKKSRAMTARDSPFWF